MKELIQKVYNEKLNDGTIEKLISNKIEQLITDSCKELFEWNGPIKKQMTEKIKGVMASAIEQSDFSTYVDAFKLVVNETLKNTKASPYAEICKSLVDLLGENVETPKVVKLSDIFEKFKDYIEEYSISNGDTGSADTDDGQCSVNVEIEIIDKDSWSNRVDVTLKVSDTEIDEDCSLKDIKYEFFFYKDSRYLFFNGHMELSDLKRVNKFETYLLNLVSNFAKVEMDIRSTEDTVYLEIEY